MLYMMMRDDKVKLINSAWAIGYGGAAEAICKMSLGNKIGFEFRIAVISRNFSRRSTEV